MTMKTEATRGNTENIVVMPKVKMAVWDRGGGESPRRQ